MEESSKEIKIKIKILERMLKNKLSKSYKIMHKRINENSIKCIIYHFNVKEITIILVLFYNIKDNKIISEKYNCINKKKIYENLRLREIKRKEKQKIERYDAKNNEYYFSCEEDIKKYIKKYILKCEKYISKYKSNEDYLFLNREHAIFGLNRYREWIINNNLFKEEYNTNFASNGCTTYYLYQSINNEYYVIVVNHLSIISSYQKIIDETWFYKYIWEKY